MPYDVIFWQVAGRQRPTLDAVRQVIAAHPGCEPGMTVQGDSITVANQDTDVRFQVMVGRPGPPRAPQPGFEEAQLVFRVDLDVPAYYGLEVFPVAVRLQESLDLFVENPKITPGSPALLRMRIEALQYNWNQANAAAVQESHFGRSARPTVPGESLIRAWRHSRERTAWPDGWHGVPVPRVFVLHETAKNRSLMACEWKWGGALVLPRVVELVLTSRRDTTGNDIEVVVSVDELILRIGRFNRPCAVPSVDAYGPCDERAHMRLLKMPVLERALYQQLAPHQVIDRELVHEPDSDGDPDVKASELRRNRRSAVKREDEPPRQYKSGEALSREGLFELLCDEVFRDGVVEAWENRLLQTVMHLLGLEPAVAISIAGHSRRRFDLGLLTGAGPVEPMRLYERLLVFVLSDGRIDQTEAAMLEGMRQVLKIADSVHQVLADKVMARTPGAADPADPLHERRVVVPADFHMLGRFVAPEGGRPWAVEVDATGRIAAFGPHAAPFWGRSAATVTHPLKRRQLVDLVTAIHEAKLMEAPGAQGPIPPTGGRELDLRQDGAFHTVRHEPGEEGRRFLDVWRMLAAFFRLSIRETTADLLDTGEWERESGYLWPNRAERDRQLAGMAERYGLTPTTEIQPLYLKTDSGEHAMWLKEVYMGLKLHGGGEVFDARAAFQRALKQAEALGEKDHHVPYALDALAAMQCHLGRMPEAEPLLRRAVSACEEAFGPEHFTVAQELDHLGLVLRKLNRPADANPVEDRAANIWRKYGGAMTQR